MGYTGDIPTLVVDINSDKNFLSFLIFLLLRIGVWYLDGCFFLFQIYIFIPERQFFLVTSHWNAQEETSSAEEQLASNKHSAHTEIV
jgi:hypothetical protein